MDYDKWKTTQYTDKLFTYCTYCGEAIYHGEECLKGDFDGIDEYLHEDCLTDFTNERFRIHSVIGGEE